MLTAGGRRSQDTRQPGGDGRVSAARHLLYQAARARNPALESTHPELVAYRCGGAQPGTRWPRGRRHHRQKKSAIGSMNSGDNCLDIYRYARGIWYPSAAGKANDDVENITAPAAAELK